MLPLIKAHTSIIGDTGYNYHARNFFKALNKMCPVQVRNWTVGPTWKEYSDEPHNSEYYMDDELKGMLCSQTLSTPTGHQDFPVYQRYPSSIFNDEPNINIVLNDNLHPYFSEIHPGINIAYNVWETTRQPDDFFEKLKKFDQVWVPSEWQKKCTIEQGIPEERVKVIPEGVDAELYQPISREIVRSSDRPFRFLVVGRWEYRKSTREIIQTFINTFATETNVELLLNVDNPFASDGLDSTEERLEKFGLAHHNVKVLHHLSRKEYVDLLKKVDVFVSCSRGEGWNLPLIEAMACGIPALYSDWGAQLEFADGRGIPVKIIAEVPAAVQNEESWNPTAPGKFAEPDFIDLSAALRDAYFKFEDYKTNALIQSDEIRSKFTWENSAAIAKETLDDLVKRRIELKKRSTAVILARADTHRRKELLGSCIRSLDTEIILSTNYPVDPEIQENVDYLVFEKENPILHREEFSRYGVDYYVWYLDPNGVRQYRPYEYEHSYAAYRLTRAGLEKAASLGKERVHIINYDYEIAKDTVLTNEGLLDEFDIIVYRQDDLDKNSSAYCSSFISGRLPALLDYFTRFDSREQYYSSIKGFNILEINLATHYAQSDFKILELSVSDLSLTNKVNQEAAGNAIIPYQDQIEINFIDGAFIEIKGNNTKEYLVKFIDSSNNTVIYSTDLKTNNWAKTSRKWFTEWMIQVEEKGSIPIEHRWDPTGRRVYVSLESSSLGDTLAWLPYVDEFGKKWSCEMVCSTFWNSLFINEYPHIQFIMPGEVAHNIYAMYKIGWFYRDTEVNFDLNPLDFKLGPLQKTASDILGLDYREIKPLISISKKERLKKVCLGINSTAQAKYWNNPIGWQEVTDWLLANGYEPIILSREEDGYMGNWYPIGATKFPAGPIESVIDQLSECQAFIGISSGLTWLAWATDTPIVQISGFTEPFNEPNDGIVKISAPSGACSGCANRLKLDAGDWDWCPDLKGTTRQFECSKLIKSVDVILALEELLS